MDFRFSRNSRFTTSCNNVAPTDFGSWSDSNIDGRVRVFFFLIYHVCTEMIHRLAFTECLNRHLAIGNLNTCIYIARPASSVGCASAWYADSSGFDPQVWQPLSRGDWS